MWVIKKNKPKTDFLRGFERGWVTFSNKMIRFFDSPEDAQETIDMMERKYGKKFELELYKAEFHPVKTTMQEEKDDG